MARELIYEENLTQLVTDFELLLPADQTAFVGEQPQCGEDYGSQDGHAPHAISHDDDETNKPNTPQPKVSKYEPPQWPNSFDEVDSMASLEPISEEELAQILANIGQLPADQTAFVREQPQYGEDYGIQVYNAPHAISHDDDETTKAAVRIISAEELANSLAPSMSSRCSSTAPYPSTPCRRLRDRNNKLSRILRGNRKAYFMLLKQELAKLEKHNRTLHSEIAHLEELLRKYTEKYSKETGGHF